VEAAAGAGIGASEGAIADDGTFATVGAGVADVIGVGAGATAESGVFVTSDFVTGVDVSGKPGTTTGAATFASAGARTDAGTPPPTGAMSEIDGAVADAGDAVAAVAELNAGEPGVDDDAATAAGFCAAAGAISEPDGTSGLSRRAGAG
jgi:hypothetical protein